jgi:hypothetical protein
MKKDIVLQSAFINHHLYWTDQLVRLFNKYSYQGLYIIECHVDYLVLINKSTGKTRRYNPALCSKKVVIYYADWDYHTYEMLIN